LKQTITKDNGTTHTLICSDFFDVEGLKADCIINDPPYNTTACSWDKTPINLQMMWSWANGVSSTSIIFGSQPFTSKVICTNISNFKYEIVWEKPKGSNYVHAKYQTLKCHENIMVFSEQGAAQGSKNPMLYNPQKTDGTPYDKGVGINTKIPLLSGGSKDNSKIILKNTTGERYPRSVVYYSNQVKKGCKLNPTQKPLELLRYLIRTYTNKGDTVLDFTAGSMSLAVACYLEGRNSICIEMDEVQYEKSVQWVKSCTEDNPYER